MHTAQKNLPCVHSFTTRLTAPPIASNLSDAARSAMMSDSWDWSVKPSKRQHSERLALLREISYEETSRIEEEEEGANQDGSTAQIRKALSLNISSGGILLLMERAPELDRVFRIHVPTPVVQAKTPTLAEVRWVRQIPFPVRSSLHLVGLKFLF